MKSSSTDDIINVKNNTKKETNMEGLFGGRDEAGDGEMEQLQQQLGALIPGGPGALAEMSSAEQAQFTEELMGSMGTALEGMFSGKLL